MSGTFEFVGDRIRRHFAVNSHINPTSTLEQSILKIGLTLKMSHQLEKSTGSFGGLGPSSYNDFVI